ncbi:MAG: riboflavin biosynthesis protein RibF [Pseudomonadota bacterium]
MVAANRIGSSVVTVGNYDGVHLGHQAIVRALVSEARRRSVPSIAVLFDPHPTVVLGTKIPPLLTTPEERGRLIKGLGVDRVVIRKFTQDLAETPAKMFLLELRNEYGMESLVVGPTTHLGKGRDGTPERLEEMGEEFGFDVNVVPQFFLNDEERVSSSEVRRSIEEGEMERARRLLGRFYRTHGTVVPGDARGRQLGFPTANVAGIPTMLPLSGVYAVWAEAGGTLLPGAANVGVRPTVKTGGSLGVEVHLLGYQGSLLGKDLPIFWGKRLREERKFSSLEELKAQIATDCGEAKTALSGLPKAVESES